MPARLPVGPNGDKFDPDRRPNHRRYAQALSAALFGRASELARYGRWSERMLHYWIEPQSRHATPFEQVSDLLSDMRALGIESWEGLLAMLCRDLGGRFVLDGEPAEQAVPARATDVAIVMHEFAEVVRAHGECVDGGCTREEADRFEAELLELEQVLHLTRRKVQAAVGRNPGPRRIAS